MQQSKSLEAEQKKNTTIKEVEEEDYDEEESYYDQWSRINTFILFSYSVAL